MPGTQTDDAGGSRSDGQENLDLLQQLGKALDAWRTKIDELRVQLDLADLDVRDEVRKRLDVAQNAYLAARSRLSDARSDAGANLNTVRQGIDQLLKDLREAYDSAEAVVRRARTR